MTIIQTGASEMDISKVPAFPSADLDKAQDMKRKAEDRKRQAEAKSKLDELLEAESLPEEAGDALRRARKTLRLILIKDGEARYQMCEDLLEIVTNAEGISPEYRRCWSNMLLTEMQDLVRGGHGKIEDVA